MIFALWQDKLYWSEGTRVCSVPFAALVKLASEPEGRSFDFGDVAHQQHDHLAGSASLERVLRTRQLVDLLLKGAALVRHPRSLSHQHRKSNEPGGSREEDSPSSSTQGA